MNYTPLQEHWAVEVNIRAQTTFILKEIKRNKAFENAPEEVVKLIDSLLLREEGLLIKAQEGFISSGALDETFKVI